MSAPTQAPSSRYKPPTTAMMRTSIVCARLIEPGEMRRLYQTDSTPAIAATKAARVNARMRCSVTLNPSARMRLGSSRSPWRARPNGVRDA